MQNPPEYCQEMMYKKNKLADSGKFKNDYRITFWGAILRKLWIDEIPMLINLIKGDITLVGVRPLSKGYFSKYPEDLQELRVKLPSSVPSKSS